MLTWLSGPRSRPTTYEEKSCSAGNRTPDLWSCSQDLSPLDHKGGRRSSRDSKICICIRSLVSVQVRFIYNWWRKNTTFKLGGKNDRPCGPEWNACNLCRAYLNVWSKRPVHFGSFNTRKIFLILYVKMGIVFIIQSYCVSGSVLNGALISWISAWTCFFFSLCRWLVGCCLMIWKATQFQLQ
jgi:hypothetical protein